jgi:hypothetical protein
MRIKHAITFECQHCSMKFQSHARLAEHRRMRPYFNVMKRFYFLIKIIFFLLQSSLRNNARDCELFALMKVAPNGWAKACHRACADENVARVCLEILLN